jgi:hypothetical protein
MPAVDAPPLLCALLFLLAVSKEVDFGGITAAEADEAFLQQAAAQIHDQAQVRLSACVQVEGVYREGRQLA